MHRPTPKSASGRHSGPAGPRTSSLGGRTAGSGSTGRFASGRSGWDPRGSSPTRTRSPSSSIADAKLGWEPVYALDVDEVAVGVASENARANDVAIETACVDLVDGTIPSATVAVANIAREP